MKSTVVGCKVFLIIFMSTASLGISTLVDSVARASACLLYNRVTCSNWMLEKDSGEPLDSSPVGSKSDLLQSEHSELNDELRNPCTRSF